MPCDQRLDLLRSLLSQAEISGGVAHMEPVVDQGSTNRMSLVETDQGKRFIFREYRWPHDGRELDRVRKEPFLHERLRQHGIPAPQVLAATHYGPWGAVLLEYLPGELLGEVTPRLEPDARDQAWSSAGQVMRRIHSITYPTGTAGVILGEDLRPFEQGSWGRFCGRDLVRHAARLQEHRPDLRIDLGRLRSLADTIESVLDEAPAVLLHNDPHPWNVLVQEAEDGWECSGWLDWEYAWVGDPVCALVTFDMFRRKPIRPTPMALWDGYGALPPEPRRVFYELQISLWMANEYLDGSRALPPTHRAAISYIEDLEAHLAHIEQVFG